VKALVTGATGFLGRPLVARLRADGLAVRALVRAGREGSVDADEASIGDLAEPASLAAAVRGVDVVFHAGARVSTTGSWEEFEAVNVRGTGELLRLAAEAGVRRIVHVSSLSVYAVPYDGAVIGEESPYDESAEERGGYARSKLEADRVVQDGIRRGLPVVVVRPGLIYGPGRRPSLARRSFALGPFRILLASRGYRLPLAYVDNVVDALCLAATVERAAGRTYTIVDAEPRQDEYARLYRQASGESWTAIYPPLTLVRAAVSVLEGACRAAGRRSPITRHQVERTLRSATFDVRRAREELGWKPAVPLDEALRRTFASLRPRPGGLQAGAA
jgi:nucleoside-diphosphate-sugar epimerase